MSLIKTVQRVAFALVFAMGIALVAETAQAAVPEILLDARTGKAKPQHDLESALVALFSRVSYAEPRWQRAPWIASQSAAPTHRIDLIR